MGNITTSGLDWLPKEYCNRGATEKSLSSKIVAQTLWSIHVIPALGSAGMALGFKADPVSKQKRKKCKDHTCQVRGEF